MAAKMRELKVELPKSQADAGITESPSAKTKKSERRREDILRQAAALFDRKGYVNTSLDDVANAVGIKREALYYYYHNRSEILLAIIKPQSIALIEGLREIMSRDISPRERLEEAIRCHLKRFDRHCLEMTISLRDGLIETSPEVRASMSKIWKEYEHQWTELIAAGQESGEFVAGRDPKMLAFGILGMCNWVARWYNPRKQASIDDLIATYSDLAIVGITNPSRAPRARRARAVGKP